MLLYHSVIFPAPSRSFEYKGAKHAHQHHMGKQVFSDFLFLALTKTFCLRKVFMRTLASHWTHPAQMGGNTAFIFLYCGWLGCVCGSFYAFCMPIMIHLHCEPTGTTMRHGVGCQWLIGHWMKVTWLNLNPPGPLIPKEWFSCSESFNWVFCDLESTFRIRGHAIKDY